MYEEITPESIKEEILSNITTVDTREGSYTNNLISPVALQIWKVYQGMNALLPIAYVDETSGEYIDKRAGEHGITRKPGTKAHAKLTFTGSDGTAIPAGTVFLTPDGLEYITSDDVTITEGSATATAAAAEVGEAYNVPAGSIVNQYNSISGLTSVTNVEAATGGTDPESDKSLVTRYYNYLQKPVTSGNTHHYEQWALEVNGVGAVKVTPLANGPGTVGVMIVGPEKQPVSAEVVSACAAHIEEQRPIGPLVIVESASALNIDVSVTVTTDTSTTAAQVQKDFSAKLDTYLKSIAFVKYQVLINQIIYILMGVDGVTDFSSLTVNGGAENITIAANQVPVLGTVVVN
ncbi:baseplate J/gp47 family protein [Caproiciproducens galactitolivorans]|uniref:Baseplate J-like protein n=1 Tax=Caproiciproducens galactitolivorans TaxID=642589 RepID=A0A4Z0Y6A6_9FIRM|nr:baseplate J/gp47 family protein [Caproiciproducens galactitolivorans]QEY34609.1 baseplate J/gp47 family protein [Caproiciproducens galactitolivorans]TGJ75428.1 baseplate J-like protein [Caproiciproducens galactitolivorans]